MTSRRVAAKAGLKPQRVHYYFRTMKELFRVLLWQLAQQNFEQLEQAVLSDKPIRALWDLNMDL
jgi:AcrR family transcriptional regulator